MNKKLIFGLALAVVLLSGSMFSAQSAPLLDRDCAANVMTPQGVAGTGGW